MALEFREKIEESQFSENFTLLIKIQKIEHSFHKILPVQTFETTAAVDPFTPPIASMNE